MNQDYKLLKNRTLKKYLKLISKLLLTVGTLYFVYKKIDVAKLISALTDADILFVLLAIIAYNASKIVAAYRLNNFYKAVGLNLTTSFNIRLYWIGMFYNLFSPGSVGGDGYKIFLLKQNSDIKLKSIFAATFFDRASGMIFLLLTTIIFVLLSSFKSPLLHFSIYLVLVLLLLIPAYYLIVRTGFPLFRKIFLKTSNQGFAMHFFQIISASLLLLSLNVSQDFLDYLALFMIASLVSVLPVTIGGAGLRELIFLGGAQYLKVEEGISIAFTLLFFIVSAVTSLTGSFFLFSIDKKVEELFTSLKEVEG